MKRLLVDTDIFSFVFKGDTRAQPFQELLDSAEICLSFMSVAELYRWGLVRKWGDSRIQELKRQIAACSILGYDDASAWHWAQITSVPGKQMGVADAWIASSVLRHGIPLLTNNRKHYEHVDGLLLVP